MLWAGWDREEKGQKIAVHDSRLRLRLGRPLRSFHPAVLIHPLRMLYYRGYAHVLPRREMTLGRDLRIAPNASLRNGARITLSDQVQIGAGAVVTRDIPAGAASPPTCLPAWC